jgi:hypothetical protein
MTRESDILEIGLRAALIIVFRSFVGSQGKSPEVLRFRICD